MRTLGRRWIAPTGGFLLAAAAAAGCAGTPAPERTTAAAAATAVTATPAPLDLSGAPSAAARRITGEEFLRLVRGNTLVRHTPDGGAMAIHVVDETRQRLSLRNGAGKVATDDGRQSVRDDSVCVTWAKIQAGRALCFAYFLDGGEIVSVDLDGRISPARFRLQPGPGVPEPTGS